MVLCDCTANLRPLLLKSRANMEDKNKPIMESPAAESELAAAQVCPVKMWNGKPCGRPFYDGAVTNEDPGRVCLMHSHDPDKDSSEFEEEIDRILHAAGDRIADFKEFVFLDVDYSERQFTANCIFVGATFIRGANSSEGVFPQGAYFYKSTFKRAANFSGTKFKAPACFDSVKFDQEAYFVNATFEQLADFQEAIFREAVRFYRAKFVRETNFVEVTFTREVDFKMAMFTQSVSFGGLTFLRLANFSDAAFAQIAGFSGVTFEQGAKFEGATFEKDAHFERATFRQDADFVRTTFAQDAHFVSSAFTQVANFTDSKFLGGARFHETDFRRDDKRHPCAIFSLAQFSRPEAVVFYKTYLGQAIFHNCDVSRLTFSSVEWRRREPSGKRMVFEEVVELKDKFASALKPATGGPDERDFGLIAGLYQQLKKNYDEKRDYSTAGDFHYGEMEMKRRSSRRRNPITRWLHSHVGLVALYKWASHYGESYIRPALWLLAILALFAALFPIAGLRYNPGRSSRQVTGRTVPGSSQSDSAVRSGESSPAIVLTYCHPFLQGEDGSHRLKTRSRLVWNSWITALDVAAFQKERVYEPAYPWGHLLILLEMVVTSTLFALFLLAVRRQFKR
jgi:uncharacterized protein YjbI with pentapeptide repeats